jgi:hypothetical protein
MVSSKLAASVLRIYVTKPIFHTLQPKAAKAGRARLHDKATKLAKASKPQDGHDLVTEGPHKRMPSNPEQRS